MLDRRKQVLIEGQIYLLFFFGKNKQSLLNKH